MLTFSINHSNEMEKSIAREVSSIIQENMGYIRKFNPKNHQEAAQAIFLHMVTHVDESKENLLPYFKKLCQKIMLKKEYESPYSTTNETGDVSHAFLTLTSENDVDNINSEETILTEFKDLYLMYPESFMKLKNVYDFESVDDTKFKSKDKIKEEDLMYNFKRILNIYGTEFTFRHLEYFFLKLNDYTNKRVKNKAKVVLLKECNYSLLDKIQENPTIKDKNGNLHSIDAKRLSMKHDPDYFDWDIIVSQSQCDILKIDLSSYMDKMFDLVMVEQGVSNDIISWCDDRYSLTTLGGTKYVRITKEKFLENVRTELILSLIGGNVGSIVAISQDYLYIKPTRIFQYDKIHLRTPKGKTYILDILLHKKGSKKRK